MKKIYFMLFLLVLALQDIHEKKISVGILLTGTILVVFDCLVFEHKAWIGLLISLLPGLCMFVIAVFSKRAGCGDGWALVLIGMFTDYRRCIAIWCISLFIMSVFCIVLLSIKRADRNTQIPFIPFLAVAYLLQLIIA